jgi:regulator of cell morphogenesis and NO signaling
MTQSTQPTAASTLADLATTRAGAARVFQRHGLDFCCHGRVSLDRACAERELDVAQILEELKDAERNGGASGFRPWDELPLPELIDHILAKFHALHREQLQFLVAAARKVESVHRDKPACPRGLADELAITAEELEDHMQKEEQVLFPLILSGRGALAAMPVQVLEMEHNDHAKRLERLRKLAHGYEAPPEACGTWRALYLGLSDFERDIHTHIHLENNVLFPRALRG